jgi:hypothetical protein
LIPSSSNLVRFGPYRTIVPQPGGGYRIGITPPKFMGGRTVSVMLTEQQFAGYLRWQRGEGLIQECLPDLSADDCEKLMSGLDRAARKRLFPKD